jgi:hypothetical protein
MTTEDLNNLGMELWGSSWKHIMADYLDINIRTMQRMAAGDQSIPAWVEREMQPHIADKIARLQLFQKPVEYIA